MSAPPRPALPPLAVPEFTSFFSELWASDDSSPVRPFPWQVELLEAAHRERRWPDVIDLPTGSGKTSLIDLAVFMLALGASEPPSQQWHPRRIAVVVDRRVIVDQAADRAARIALRLEKAESGVLRTVADRLRSLALQPDGSTPQTPLRHAVLRGGIVRDESWAYRPDVPAVIGSTVDQVGSRLLLRGYGVSRGMRPVHAGLLGEDVLYLLDEVHLARPYAETLKAVGRYRHQGDQAAALPNRWQAIQLSATVDDTTGWVFPGRALDPDSHPVLGRRLTARKPAALVEVVTPADPMRARQRLARTCAERAAALVASGARTIAVIVNRVDTARRAYAEVRAASSDVSVRMITGRMRPIDRDQVLAEIRERVGMGRVRHDTDQPLILVATQSIEAGADFDLDAIVTECASLDALRQRFGRVDRDGALGAAGRTYESTILAASSDVADGTVDPVYGEALHQTWRWLTGLPQVDFGIQRLQTPESAQGLGKLLPPRRHAPHLLPSHLDRWVRTSHYGVAADPEVAQWLHGIDASNEATDVSVVWREDIDEGLLARALSDRDLRHGVANRLNACPPMPREMLAVPLGSVRAWLGGAPDELPLADAWANSGAPDNTPFDGGRRAVLCWRDDHAELVGVNGIGPGDTIVVPAAWGGLVGGTWDPGSTALVLDVADEAYSDRQPLGRLSRVLDERWRGAARVALAQASSESAVDAAADDVVAVAVEFPDPAVLGELPAADRAAAVRAYMTAMIDYADVATRVTLNRLLDVSLWTLQPFVERLAEGEALHSYVVTAKPTPSSRKDVNPYSGLADDDGRDGPSFADADVPSLITLSDHLDGVRRWAECLATNLGFSSELVAAIGQAGQLHDLGKLDPRFQLWLHDGNELALESVSRPLAKSVTVGDRRAREAARGRSGYPTGQRHELLSLSLAPVLASEPYADLVRHLIAVHHGYGRYRFEPQRDLPAVDICFKVGAHTIGGTTTHGLDRLDSGIADRFWRLVREWGWFALVWLEAILRLADHQDSRSPQVAATARRQQ